MLAHVMTKIRKLHSFGENRPRLWGTMGDDFKRALCCCLERKLAGVTVSIQQPISPLRTDIHHMAILLRRSSKRYLAVTSPTTVQRDTPGFAFVVGVVDLENSRSESVLSFLISLLECCAFGGVLYLATSVEVQKGQGSSLLR